MKPHDPDPHHTAQGEWVCFATEGKERCNRPLKGSYLRPVIPWEHRPLAPREAGAISHLEVALPGLGTTE